jgi:hypothetical protein
MFNLEEYTTVRERIKMFWEKYPNGRLHTEILDWSDKRFIVKAEVYADRGDAFPIATGLANEIVGSSNVNRDFALENCATSSLGIAIGNAGLGIDKQKASRDEMAKVVATKVVKPPVQDLVPDQQDYWTTPVNEYMKVVDAPVTLDKAMENVAAIMGTAEASEVPTCSHGHRVWKTGKAKTGKEWAHYSCPLLGHAGMEGKCEPIWYEINNVGKWQPQRARG